jgi:hypothetical protein
MKPIFLLLAGVMFFPACTPFKMSVSDDLKQDHDEYSVKGRQGILIKQKLGFGEFATTKVKRSWTRGHSSRSGIGYTDAITRDWVNIISMEYIDKKQTMNFSLSDGVRQSDVYCVTRFNAEDLQVGKRENSLLNIGMDIAGIGNLSTSLYYVQLYTGNDEQPWQLVLDNQATQAKPGKYTGVLAKSRSEYYTIVPVTKLEKNGKSGNTLAGSVGFEIKNPEGRSVAAVSLIDKGMVFLAKVNPEERFLLANLCAALLLQEEIGS